MAGRIREGQHILQLFLRQRSDNLQVSDLQKDIVLSPGFARQHKGGDQQGRGYRLPERLRAVREVVRGEREFPDVHVHRVPAGRLHGAVLPAGEVLRSGGWEVHADGCPVWRDDIAPEHEQVCLLHERSCIVDRPVRHEGGEAESRNLVEVLFCIGFRDYLN